MSEIVKSVAEMTDAEIIKELEEQQRLQKEFYEIAIAERAKQEVQVAQWFESIKQVPAEVLESLQLPEEITLKSLLPELYKPFEEFQQEEYDRQYAKVQEFLSKYNAIAMEYNRKQIMLRREMEKLSTGG